MLKNFLLPILLISFISFFPQNSNAQCPGCLIDLPGTLEEDAIFMTDIPEGQSGMAYDKDVSFRLPKTTTPVNATDPSIPAGITINKFNISTVNNLPPGLLWEANQSEYFPATQTDGCIKLCGTPLLPGWYTIEVKLIATIAVLEQESSFVVEMYIAPAVTTNDGFSMSNFVDCGEVEVDFVNNVPSNGNPGFSYNWDFGNGNTSTDENPGSQIYDQPGTYYVDYTATIDTVGYFLTDVNVVSSDCNDWPNAAPDLLVNILDVTLGTVVYESEKQTNIWPPVSFETNIKLEDGHSYFLQVIDIDTGINGADDVCATQIFDQLSNGTFTGPGWEVNLEIIHPLITVTTTDTVIVYPMPETPGIVATDTEACPDLRVVYASSITENIQWYKDGIAIDGATAQGLEIIESGVYSIGHSNEFGCIAFSEEIEFTLLEAPDAPALVSDIGTEFCDGEEAVLMSSYNDNNQWYLNEIEIDGETEPTLMVDASGIYTVAYTNSVGCSAQSEEMTITVFDNPAEPVFENSENVLTLQSTIVIPNNFTLVWYYNGIELMGENSNALCIDTPGNYTLVLTDTDTGCSSSYSSDAMLDPAHNCLVSGIEELAVQQVLIAPNPVQTMLQISFELETTEAIQLQLFDLSGRQIQNQNLGLVSGRVTTEMNLSALASGMYLLHLRGEQGGQQYKIVKQ